MKEYEILYQYANQELNLNWVWLCILVIVFGLLFVIRQKRKKYFSTVHFTIGIVIISLLTVFTVLITLFTVKEREYVKDLEKNNKLKVVEGIVENFLPMKRGYRKEDSFSIKGVHFEYSDYEKIQGFNQTKSFGGPITGDGQYLRVTYYTINDRNYIVKIEGKVE